MALEPVGRRGERITGAAAVAGIAPFAPIPGGRLEESTPVQHGEIIVALMIVALMIVALMIVALMKHRHSMGK